MKLKMSIAEIADATGECNQVVYAAIRAGDLKTFLVGRRRFSKPADVQKWVDYLQAESDAGRPVSYAARERKAAA